jgi:saccharopine dehydrogenase (NAD+, L-lysine-forming)
MTNKKHVVVIGGYGGVGRKVVRELVKSDLFSELVVAGRHPENAREVAAELAESKVKVSVERVDADEEQSLLQVMDGADLVVNLAGPYDKIGVKTVKAAIKAKIDYVDVNDNVAATQEVLALDKAAIAAAVTVLIGCGVSPGLTNIFARYGADRLDEVDEIHSAWVVNRGPGGLASRENMLRNTFADPVPIYKDSQFVDVPARTEKEMILLPGLPGAAEVMLAKHPELITNPRFIKGVKLVTHKGGYTPQQWGNDLICNLFDWGLASVEPIIVKGIPIAPVDFTAAFLASEVAAKVQRLREVQPLLAVQVRVVGKEDGKATTYIYRCVDQQRIGVALTCAIGAQMLAQGKVEAKGVIGPEVLDPEPFIRAIMERGLIVEEVREQVL